MLKCRVITCFILIFSLLFSGIASATIITDGNNTSNSTNITVNNITALSTTLNKSHTLSNSSNTTNNITDSNINSNANIKDAANVGKIVMQDAKNDPELGFNESNDTLLITNAGSLELNNATTEGSLESIMNITSSLQYGQVISYGKANIISISSLNGTPLEFTFITKLTNGTLMAKKFIITGNGTSYTMNMSETVCISANMDNVQWNICTNQLGDNAFNLIIIANAWDSGAPMDLLSEAKTSTNITYGVVNGYIMTESMLTYYGENSGNEYVILTSPGGTDAPTYLMPWNYKYNALNGNNPLETAYIYWNTISKTGDLVLMKFNNNLISQFENQTELTISNGNLSEIKFTDWIINLLNNGRASEIVTVEKTAVINQTDLDYLYGTNTTVGQGMSTTGLNYIMKLTTATPFTVLMTVPSSDYNQFKEAGSEMAEYATNVLNSLPNSDGSQISVESAPVYATVEGSLILGFYDGITNVLKTYDPNNLLTLDNPYNFESYLNNELIAIFMQKVGVDSAGNALINCIEAIYDYNSNMITYSYAIQVNSTSDTYKNYIENTAIEGSGENKYSLNSTPTPIGDMYSMGSGSMSGSTFWNMPAWMRSAELWGSGASYSFMSNWMMTSCCCWDPGLQLFANYAKQLLPLGANEVYKVIGVPYDSVVNQYSSFELAKSVTAMESNFDVSVSTGTFEPVELPDGKVIIAAYNTITNAYKVIILSTTSNYYQNQQIEDSKSSNTNFPDTSDINFLNMVDQGLTSYTTSTIATASVISSSIMTLTAEQLNELMATLTGQENSNPGGSSGKSGSTSGSTSSTSNSASASTQGTSNSQQGTSGTAAAAAVTGGSGSDSGQNAHEITTTPGNSNNNTQSGTPLAETAGVVLIVCLLGAGYFLRRK
jgi:formylmethanofuran dehydrogenase subunit E-like metal-binding protein